mgnify:CR=1 FL=1
MDRFQFRRDTSARWTEINPILLEGEIGVETDTKLRKMGDGTNTWNNLDYLAAENITQELGNSEAAVISQKGIDNILTSVDVGTIDINISTLPTQNCTLGVNNLWYSLTKSSHKAIKVNANYTKIIISPNIDIFIGFLNENYNPPYISGNPIPYITNTSRIWVKGGVSTTLDIPVNAKYIIFPMVDGNDNTISYSSLLMVKRNGIFTTMDEISKNLHIATSIIGGTSNSTVELVKLQAQQCALGGGGKWYLGAEQARHKAIQLEPYYGKVSIKSNIDAFIGFLDSSYKPPYSNGNITPYVEGADRIVVYGNNISNIIEIPLNSAFLVLTTVDGSGNTITYNDVTLIPREGLLQTVDGMVDKVYEADSAINGLAEDTIINLDSLNQNKCSLGSTNWFYLIPSGSYHKAIKLPGGCDRVSVNPDKDVFLGFVTDNYNPPYNSGDVIPFCKGTGRLLVTSGKDNIFNVPTDAAYLILITKDGAGQDINYNNITLLSSLGLKSKVENNINEIKSLKDNIRPEYSPKGVFGIMTYNVGNWYNGSGVPLPDSLVEVYLPLQEGIFKRYNPDIVFMQEFFNTITSSLPVSDFLRSYYLYSVDGNTSYNGKAIASKSGVMDIETKVFVNNDALNRNYLKGYTYCNGRKVLLISAHLAINNSIAAMQLEELIKEVEGEEYVVIGVDSNIDISSTEGKLIFQRITDANLQYVNKDIVTYPNTSTCIDNFILTNNISIKSAYTDKSKLGLDTDVDHLPLVSYVEIY